MSEIPTLLASHYGSVENSDMTPSENTVSDVHVAPPPRECIRCGTRCWVPISEHPYWKNGCASKMEMQPIPKPKPKPVSWLTLPIAAVLP
jgi:hypothetical protein